MASILYGGKVTHSPSSQSVRRGGRFPAASTPHGDLFVEARQVADGLVTPAVDHLDTEPDQVADSFPVHPLTGPQPTLARPIPVP